MDVDAPTSAEADAGGRSATWWMAVLFAAGSACFVVASIPGFVQLVGSRLDSTIYFVGSILFTSAATIQWLTGRGLAFEVRGLDWWSNTVQLVGTLYFNVTTFRAFQTGLDANEYDKLVWTPDALGSVCFLVSSYLACVAISGLTARPRRTRDSAIATVNLVGSVAFGIAAVASYVVPAGGSALSLAWANVFTALGGLCFLAGALLLLPRAAGR